jgi:hypothetical protein
MSDPDWVSRCTVADLYKIDGPFMMRTSEDSDSPWRTVSTHRLGFWTDRESGARVDYLTVEFHDDVAERVLNPDEEIEVGLIRPPSWPADATPPEWPRRPA